MSSELLKQIKKISKEAVSLMSSGIRLDFIHKYHDLKNIALQKGPFTGLNQKAFDNKTALTAHIKAIGDVLERLQTLVSGDFIIDINASLERTASLVNLRKKIGELVNQLANEKLAYEKILEEQNRYCEIITKFDLATCRQNAKILIKDHVDKQANDFQNNIHPHQETWAKLSPRLEVLYTKNGLDSPEYETTQFAQLLHPRDRSFLDFISPIFSMMIHDGELGHLAFARLYAMFSLFHVTPSQAPNIMQVDNRPEVLAIAKVYNAAMSAENPGLFEFDQETLLCEIVKLYLHKQLNPEGMRIWLGNWIKIQNISHQFPGMGIYLNADDDKYTWCLNRTYIQLAGELGYEMVFPQKQEQNVSEALLTQDPASLVSEAAGEVRRAKATVSMYHIDDRPTFTMQEMIALLDMRFEVKYSDDEKMFRMHPQGTLPQPQNALFQEKNKLFQEKEPEGRDFFPEEIHRIWINYYFAKGGSSSPVPHGYSHPFSGLLKRTMDLQSRITDLIDPNNKAIHPHQRRLFLSYLRQLALIKHMITDAACIWKNELEVLFSVELFPNLSVNMIENYLDRYLSKMEDSYTTHLTQVASQNRAKEQKCMNECAQYVADIEMIVGTFKTPADRFTVFDEHMKDFAYYQDHVKNKLSFSKSEVKILQAMHDNVLAGVKNLCSQYKNA